jgi:beta-glucosidase-like glycosyl hydrolase
MLRALALCGAIAASAASAAAPAGGLPNYHGCATPLALSHSYCNLSLSHLQRVDSLLALLTLEEKVGLIAPDPSMGDTCFAHIHAIPRVGLPEYGWLVETNTGVASQCLGPGRCATTFSGPTGLGASFNRSVWSQKGNVLSTEMRAFSNARWIRGIGTSYPGHIESTASFIGTSAFGPNLNIIRDPRYGRNSELPSEDPFLTGELGKAEVIAMQTTDVAGHPRVNAYLKHFTAYSTETNRMHSDFNMTDFDLFDTYLPQYEKVFTEANAAGAMCSYVRTDYTTVLPSVEFRGR